MVFLPDDVRRRFACRRPIAAGVSRHCLRTGYDTPGWAVDLLRVIKAQTTRAFLFASATEARRGGRRWSTARSHAPASLFHCAARLTIDVVHFNAVG
jgi:hypothetical protein